VEVDLYDQVVRTEDGEFGFDIAPASKAALIEGLDLIGSTLRLESEIAAYEARTTSWMPGNPR
jgi:3-isopropylmalate/(R)-2-methylmalate dehydratase small subunit